MALLTKREIDLIRDCLSDGSYTALEKKYFSALCDMALASLEPSAEREDWTKRYYVEQQGFWWWVVKCGTGERTLFKAHTKSGCEEMAQELTTAFNDGLFAALSQPRANGDANG